MARSIFATRPRRITLLDRYLAEPIRYGGEVCTRLEVMRDLRRCGLDDRSIDRYLQGAELRQRLDDQNRLHLPGTDLIQ